MDKNEITPINRDFLQGVSDVLAHARKNAKTAVNLSKPSLPKQLPTVRLLLPLNSLRAR